MTITQYTRGLNMWDPAGTYRALMVDGYTPDPSHTLATILTDESVAVGYARTGTFTVTETFVDTVGYEESRLDSADLTFGTLAADDTTPSHLIVIRWITNDAGSIALAAHSVDTFRSTFPTVRVSSRGLMRSVANV